MTVSAHHVNRAPHPSGLADVLDLILDKGIVIDAYVRLALVGIEILTLDARIVIASVDTYLHFAEAVNRLDIQPSQQPTGLPGLIGQLEEGGARHKTRGAISGILDSAREGIESAMQSSKPQQAQQQAAQQAPQQAPRQGGQSSGQSQGGGQSSGSGSSQGQSSGQGGQQQKPQGG